MLDEMPPWWLEAGGRQVWVALGLYHSCGTLIVKHIGIKKPKTWLSKLHIYYNYKDYFSAVLVALVDMDFGANRSLLDSGILNRFSPGQSSAKKHRVYLHQLPSHTMTETFPISSLETMPFRWRLIS